MQIDIGSNILSVLGKSYPSNKKLGVPNNKIPTPKMDWVITSKIIIDTSNIKRDIFGSSIIKDFTKVQFFLRKKTHLKVVF